MKKAITVLVGGLILGLVGVASGTPLAYEDIIDFDATGTYLSKTYTSVSDLNPSTDTNVAYTHTVAFSPAAASIDRASVTIDYAYANDKAGASSNPIEAFFLWDNGSTPVQIGELTGALGSTSWQSQTFDLTTFIADEIAAASGSSWSIAFTFLENTNSPDTFYLDQSKLFGEYTDATIGGLAAVPEPSTFLLLGGGLAGLFFVVPRRKKE
jgi:hypothetical protein